MTDLPDSPRRLRLRVTLKLMMALAGVVVVTIGVRYLAGGDGAPDRLRIDVSGLKPGTVRTVGWRERPVIVLRRDRETMERLGPRLADDPSPDWFVAFANGTARSCTVIWEPGRRRFRESCGEAAWDAAGDPLPGTDAAPLKVPPHRFSGDGRLRLGADAPGQGRSDYAGDLQVGVAWRFHAPRPSGWRAGPFPADRSVRHSQATDLSG